MGAGRWRTAIPESRQPRQPYPRRPAPWKRWKNVSPRGMRGGPGQPGLGPFRSTASSSPARSWGRGSRGGRSGGRDGLGSRPHLRSIRPRLGPGQPRPSPYRSAAWRGVAGRAPPGPHIHPPHPATYRTGRENLKGVKDGGRQPSLWAGGRVGWRERLLRGRCRGRADRSLTTGRGRRMVR